MAVMLVEMAIRAVASYLQANLNAEIGHVEREADLGLDLPIVTGWRGYDAGVATPDVVEAEVFDRAEITFPLAAYDESSRQVWPGGRTRVSSLIPMRAAINHANRGNADDGHATLTASQMKSRTNLYGAALTRVLRNDPSCGVPGAAIFPVSLRATVRDVERLTDELRRAARVEFDFDLSLYESHAGETTVGGGALPAVSLEIP